MKKINEPGKIIYRVTRKISVVFFANFKIILSLFRSVHPKSQKFGFDRGGPINHYYIEKFIEENSQCIRGTVLEIADSRYTKKFGKNVIKSEILHFLNDNLKATIIADLTKTDGLPENFADCFIFTQTLNFIYDFKSALRGTYRLLKPDGVLLATVSGISQISRYDMDRWGDYWRFTTLSCEKMFKEVFGAENVTVDFYGNCLSARAFLNGQSSLELTKKELDYKDNDYQVLITIKARKKLTGTIKTVK
jgi:hypothetical protein